MQCDFLSFWQGLYAEPECGYSLYVIRESAERVLYVGQSRDNVWNRWFGSSRSHMMRNAGGYWVGMSDVGEMILAHLPQSLEWTVELYTTQCAADEYLKGSDRFDLTDVERAMIDTLRPHLNVSHSMK